MVAYRLCIRQDSKPSNERDAHQVQTYTSLERRTVIVIDTTDQWTGM